MITEPGILTALFVEKNGCYWDIPGIDPWDISRDARLYQGPHPVIAHPPCERWGNFAQGSMLKKTYTLGDDGGCFQSALNSVLKYGGILEHPAYSRAWPYFGIDAPEKTGWKKIGTNEWTCQVEQGNYGHRARKKTWLFFVGQKNPPELIWTPCPQRLPEKRLAERGYESARRCGIVANMSRKQRQQTPKLFRDLLIHIARNITPVCTQPRSIQ